MKDMFLFVLNEHFNWLLAAVCLLGFIVLSMFLRRGNRGKARYAPIEFVNTKAEHNFFIQLQRKLPEEFYVLCKLRLADICKPFDAKNIPAFNKIARKHVDFVVIDKSTSKVRFAIELDDRSHQQRDSIRRDKEKDHALSSAGVTLFRIRAAKNYTKVLDGILTDMSTSKDKASVVEELECPRCPSKMELIKLKGFLNRGKGYYLCDNCGYHTQDFKLH
ncbi:DUF2726 domain-containing protein [Vibrio coralliilyticus]|uniref:DUF2726 domain-containing protein n=1 Tax=Vibrio coralliilyticus TaxID=190893 RepID=A0AAP6ZNP3_9VIBR|nr:DUF2726 domain-containing protein [Vibrio coralliilyticus]NOI31850.1 DUF2726 domain-containing protein [Vibrio coralliilyticus]NOJ25294.1 DUF2726 domain-containing protein [Vibrio coralliilyticus]